MPTSPTDRTDPADPTDGRWQDEDVFVEGEEDGYYERLVETAGHEREQGHEHDAYGKGGDIAMEKERWRGHDMDLDRDTDENVIALVRSASIGRRIGKPTLTLVRTSSHRSSSSGEKKPQPQPQPSGGRSSVDSSLGTAYIGPRPVPKPVQTAEQVLLGGVIVNGAGGGFRDHSDDSETLPQLPRLQDRDGVGLHHDADAATRTRIASDGEEAERARRIGAIRDREAQRAAMRGQYRQSSWPETGDADQQISVLCPGGPPRVRDPDDPEGATRERASLTSLPDLIRRATRLAGMIDRGKRPASRIDALDVSSSEDISGAGKEAGAGGRLTGETMRTGRISPGILNAFPVPLTSASGTNTRSGTARTGTGGGGGGRGGFTKRGVGVQVGEKGYWTGDAGDRGDRDRATKRGKRRCGLPTRWFLLALLLVILLIAAAIFVPLYFTVFRHRSSSSTSSSGTASAPFNGTSIPTDGDSVACTSLAIHGTTYSYKVGYAILRLLEQGPGNFSIPLDAATVVERFGAAGASCGVMNALVSFNGTNGATADSGGGGGGGSAAGAAGRKRKRDGTTATTTTSEAPIAVATGSPIPSPATTAGSGSGSATGGGTASASGAGFVLNSTHIDFARVALLYILSANNTADETSPFGIAVQAQTSLQTWFYNVERFGVSGYGPGNVIVGGDHSVNFIDFEIDGVGGGYRATG